MFPIRMASSAKAGLRIFLHLMLVCTQAADATKGGRHGGRGEGPRCPVRLKDRWLDDFGWIHCQAAKAWWLPPVRADEKVAANSPGTNREAAAKWTLADCLLSNTNIRPLEPVELDLALRSFTTRSEGILGDGHRSCHSRIRGRGGCCQHLIGLDDCGKRRMAGGGLVGVSSRGLPLRGVISCCSADLDSSYNGIDILLKL